MKTDTIRRLDLSNVTEWHLVWRGADEGNCREVAVAVTVETQRRIAHLEVARASLVAAVEFAALERRLGQEIAELRDRAAQAARVATAPDAWARLCELRA